MGGVSLAGQIICITDVSVMPQGSHPPRGGARLGLYSTCANTSCWFSGPRATVPAMLSTEQLVTCIPSALLAWLAVEPRVHLLCLDSCVFYSGMTRKVRHTAMLASNEYVGVVGGPLLAFSRL